MVKICLSLLLLAVTLLGHAPDSDYLVAIILRTSDGRRGVQAMVNLGGHVQPTDTDGKAVFTGYAPGKYELLVSPEPPYKWFRWIVTVPASAPIVFKLDKPE